jgi:hypothetical protein
MMFSTLLKAAQPSAILLFTSESRSPFLITYQFCPPLQ